MARAPDPDRPGHGLTHRHADTERYRRGWRRPSSAVSWRRA